MMKFSEELKTVPTWFENFTNEKLYENSVPMIRYLIWLLQASCVFSLLSIFRVNIQMNALYGYGTVPGGGVAFMGAMLASFFTVPLTQMIVLGIQAKSKLAWILLVASALSMLCSMLFPVGLLMFVFLNQDEVIDYFNAKVTV